MSHLFYKNDRAVYLPALYPPSYVRPVSNEAVSDVRAEFQPRHLDYLGRLNLLSPTAFFRYPNVLISAGLAELERALHIVALA